LKVNRIVPFRNYNFNLRIINILNSDEFPFDPDFIPIFDSANI